MKPLYERLREIDKEIAEEYARNASEISRLQAQKEQVTKDFYKEIDQLKKKNFANLVKELTNILLQNQHIQKVIKSRKPFEIVIEKSKNLKHSELYSIVKRQTKLAWVSESSGIPNVYIFSLSEKERAKLEPKI